MARFAYCQEFRLFQTLPSLFACSFNFICARVLLQCGPGRTVMADWARKINNMHLSIFFDCKVVSVMGGESDVYS